MDLVTHGLTALVVARAATGRVSGRDGAAVAAGALAPDLDVLPGLWDPAVSLVLHRLPTHSLLGGLALALVLACIIRGIGGGRYRPLAALVYLGVLTHVILDVFTPSGTAVLWPLDSRRLSVGSLYMIDPVVISIGAASLMPATWWKRPGARVARAGLLALCGYLLLGAGVRTGVEARWARVLAGDGPVVTRSTVVPAFPGPLRWLGVAETPSMILRARFWAWEVAASPAEVFPRGTPDPALPQVEAHWAVRAFLEAARFPWRRTLIEGESRVVEFRELAFQDHPFGGPMVLRARVGPSGAVQAVEFDHRL